MVPPDKKLKLFVVIILQLLELTLSFVKSSFVFGGEFVIKIREEKSSLKMKLEDFFGGKPLTRDTN